MTNAYKNYGNKETPQSQPIPGQEDTMAKNDAGGYAYTIDKWSMLDRFLILGSEGGTYYTKPQEMTVRNANNVLACIAENGLRTVDRIYEISVEGRAVKNTPALFALALAQWKGDDKTRQAAYLALPKVARTGYHLLMWADFSDNMRGTGSGWQKAVSRWFNDKDPDKLAYQMIKYQQREGWAMSDLLRLAHTKPVDPQHDNIYKWVVDGWSDDWLEINKITPEPLPVPDIIWAHEIAKQADTPIEIVGLIAKYRLPRESIPTQFLNDVDVWEALLNTGMPLTAMIRNLGKMTSVKLLSPFTLAVDTVVENLTNEEYLRKSRVHPLAILVAQKVYASGKGMKGSLEWKPVPQIIDALDAAFYASFGNITPTNKKTMLALDVSGSMTSLDIAGMPLSPREASAAMALVTANVEPNYMVTAFSDGKLGGGWTDDGICVLPISPKQRLADVIKTVDNLAFGGTDCALPMLYAIDEGYAIDMFTVFTDNETWAGKIHPSQALKKHQRKFDMQSKLAVVGMTSTNFSIADPDSPDMLDVVGFDTATPQIISDFSLNKI